MTGEIRKYPLMMVDSQEVEMPAGSEILHVGVQKGTPTVWAIVDPEETTFAEKRIIEIYGTGHRIEDTEHSVYLGTVMDGPFVWHVFERES